jgi:hypothetical protein
MKPNKEALLWWADALDSGIYEQGHNMLETKAGKNCCLGVACRLAVAQGLILMERADDAVLFGGSWAALPPEVKDHLGIYDDFLMLEIDGEQALLAIHNDGARHFNSGEFRIRKKTFREIAKAIRDFANSLPATDLSQELPSQTLTATASDH